MSGLRHRSGSTCRATTNKLTFEIIARAGFSHSFGSLADSNSGSFVEAMVRELAYANRRTDVLPLFDKVFRCDDHDRHNADLTHAHAFVDDIVEARTSDPHREYHDILDLMLDSVDPETGERLDTVNIRNQILTFLIAGSETSANTIAFALHYLSTRPDIAATVRAELDERWPTMEFPDVRDDDVAKRRGLRRVIDETLRLWPTGPGYFRRAKRDTTLCGRYRFAKKDWVLVCSSPPTETRPGAPTQTSSTPTDSCRTTSAAYRPASTNLSAPGPVPASAASSPTTK